MSDFGLKESGFIIKRLTDIKGEIEDELREAFGPILTTPESVFGNVIGAPSKKLAELWELASVVYGWQFPINAEGLSLDNAVQYTGITRLPATKTTVEVIMEGVAGTTVPAGTQVSDALNNYVFELDSATDILLTNQLRTVFEITDAQDLTVYTIKLTQADPFTNGDVGDETSITLSITSTVSASEESIAFALVQEINNEVNVDGITATDNEDGTFKIQRDDGSTIYESEIITDTRIDYSEIWSPALFSAIEEGAKEAPEASVTVIETPVAGLNSVDNLLDGITGRDIESDIDLRIRRRNSLQIIGASTVPAIRARILQEIDGITKCSVFDNRTDVVDAFGRPPHSVHVIVDGAQGSDQEIGEKIWEVKAGGIETFGDIEIDVIDSEGYTQVMRFDRPTQLFAWMRVTIDEYNTEEVFPLNGSDQIKTNVVAFGDTLDMGEDYIIQKFYCPIFEVDGLKRVTIEIATTPTAVDVPVYGTVDISVDPVEVLNFDVSRVEVVL